MMEPFGKRNRPQVAKPQRAKLHKPTRSVSPPGKSRFYLLVGATLLVLIVGGYAWQCDAALPGGVMRPASFD